MTLSEASVWRLSEPNICSHAPRRRGDRRAQHQNRGRLIASTISNSEHVLTEPS
jgi:hypothetical protein